MLSHAQSAWRALPDLEAKDAEFRVKVGKDREEAFWNIEGANLDILEVRGGFKEVPRLGGHGGGMVKGERLEVQRPWQNWPVFRIILVLFLLELITQA